MASTVFKYPITTFSTRSTRTGGINSFNSSIFSPDDTGANFNLRFVPKSPGVIGAETSCTMYLILADLWDDDLDSTNVQFKLWIENSHGQKRPEQPKVITNSFTREQTMRGLYRFMNSDELYSQDDDDEFIKNDYLLLCCEILPIKEEKKELPPFEHEFNEKMYSLYDQGIKGDCVLQVAGEEFKVPKTLLMASSEVFERMLTAETQEKQSSIIKIEDVRSEIMDKFIKYLYIRSFSADMEDIAEELFILADRYAVQLLLDECVNTLSIAFTKDNIVRNLQLAFTHINEEFKKRALFYAKDFANQIMHSDQWKQLSTQNKELTDEIQFAIVGKLSSF